MNDLRQMLMLETSGAEAELRTRSSCSQTHNNGSIYTQSRLKINHENNLSKQPNYIQRNNLTEKKLTESLESFSLKYSLYHFKCLLIYCSKVWSVRFFNFIYLFIYFYFF